MLFTAINQSSPISRKTSTVYPLRQLCFHYKVKVLIPSEPFSSHLSIVFFFLIYVNYMPFRFLFTNHSLINEQTNQISHYDLNIHLQSYLLYFPETQCRFKLFEINKTYCLHKSVHLFFFHKYSENY